MPLSLAGTGANHSGDYSVAFGVVPPFRTPHPHPPSGISVPTDQYLSGGNNSATLIRSNDERTWGGGANIVKGEEVWVPETELLSCITGDGDTWRARELLILAGFILYATATSTDGNPHLATGEPWAEIIQHCSVR